MYPCSELQRVGGLMEQRDAGSDAAAKWEEASADLELLTRDQPINTFRAA